ncbi:MAG: SH3 domain-containing protein [Caldilineaceae bacterium]|nr:SH3 domain-containing protein [Caldilineaceae bacterium]
MRTRLSLLLATAILLASCSFGPTPAPPMPTNTPLPTFTPTVEVVIAPVDPGAAATARAAEEQATAAAQTAANPQATQAPAQEPTATDTPVPAEASLTVNSAMNVRSGPGTNYGIVGSANAGQRFTVTGKNGAGDWWQINFNGQTGWVFGQLVTGENTGGVQVAANIPAPPPPTSPPPPPPTNTPAPAAPAPAPAPAANFPFQLLETTSCNPNEGTTYFSGFVRYPDNSPQNGVCVHIAYYGPRNTKCSGCDGVGDGVWGFSPFGGPAPTGTTVEIFIVQCPGPMPLGGQTEASGFGDLTPQSPKWTKTFSQSEQCTGITFVSR